MNRPQVSDIQNLPDPEFDELHTPDQRAQALYAALQPSKSVFIETLKPGDIFRYDTRDVIAQSARHRVLGVEANGNVRVQLFLDARITTWCKPDTLVFHAEAL